MLRDQNEFPTIMLAGIQEIQNVTQELSGIDYGYCILAGWVGGRKLGGNPTDNTITVFTRFRPRILTNVKHAKRNHQRLA